MKLWSRKNTKVFLFDFVSKFVGYAFLPWYLVHMSQREFGLYTYLYYVVTTVAAVAGLGFTTSVGALYNQFPAERGKMLFSISSVLYSVLLLLIVACITTDFDVKVMGAFVNDSSFDYKKVRSAVMAYIVFFVLYGQLSVYFQFSGKILLFQKFNASRLLITNIVAIYVIANSSVDGYIVRLGAEATLSCLVFLPLIAIYVGALEMGLLWDAIKRALLIGLPIVGGSLSALLITLGDKFFLQKYSNVEELAIYNLAFMLVAPIGFAFTTVNLVWVPEFFSDAHQQSSIRKTKHILAQLSAPITGIALIIWMLLYFLIAQFGKLVGYEKVLYIFPLISLAAIFDGMTGYAINYLICFEKTWIALLASWTHASLLLLLSFWLVPIFQIWATVFILVLLSFVRLVLLFWIVNSMLKKSDAT